MTSMERFSGPVGEPNFPISVGYSPQFDNVIEESKAEDQIKLFVGQVPKTYTENELRQIFVQYGPIKDVFIIRDKGTNSHRGCAFITYESVASAHRAVAEAHDRITLPGMSKPVQIKPANDPPPKEFKLFVAKLPSELNEDDVKSIFYKYGIVKEVYIMRESSGASKGCAFVKYGSKAEAQAAIHGLNDKAMLQGSPNKLIVRFADDKDAKAAKVVKQVQQNIMNIFSNPMINPYAAAAAAAAFAGMANPSTFPMAQALLQQGVSKWLSGAADPSSPRGMANMTSMAGILQGSAARKPQQEVRGPDGANLFVYNIPTYYGENELATLFGNFGRVLSATVFRDKVTGQSKGFGFVSYDSADHAVNAISQLDGFVIEDRKLKVQLKSSKMDKTSPYFK